MNDKLKKTHTLKDLTKDCNGNLTTGANFMESVIVNCEHKNQGMKLKATGRVRRERLNDK